jgi:small ligand-binding sensory domain FIST
LLLIGDLFFFPADQWLQLINNQHASLPVFGGMASGGMGPGGNYLFFQDQMFSEGAAGLFLKGVTIRNVVSQGCRSASQW